MTSKKRLMADLATMKGVNYAGNETYGRRSFIYLAVLAPKTKATLVNALRVLGHKVEKGWTQQNSGIAVQVSYFKGHHWDE